MAVVEVTAAPLSAGVARVSLPLWDRLLLCGFAVEVQRVQSSGLGSPT